MSCFPELTYSIYVDGELPGDEARRVEGHLASCARCRELIAQMRTENELLISALAITEDVVPAAVAMRPAAWWQVLTRGVPLAATAVLLSSFLQWVAQQVPAATDWMNPSAMVGRLNLLFAGLFYVLDQGAAMLSSITALATILIAATFVFAAVTFASRSRIRFLRPGAGLLALLVLSLPGYGLETRSSKTTVTVAANETIDDSLFATGDTIRVDGIINGDLLAFGRRVEIRGTVKGSVMTWAQRVDISGTVEGNICGGGQNVDLGGQVGRNVYLWAQFFNLARAGRIGGGMVVGGADLALDGNVARSINVFAGNADASGEVGREFHFAGGKLNLSPPAHIGGNLTAKVKRTQDVQVASGVVIGGKTDIRLNVVKNRFAQPKFYFWQAVSLVGAMIIGWLMLVFMPGFFQGTVQALRGTGRSLGLGFAVLVATPVALIVLGVTLIGLPVAFFGLALYAAALYLAKIFVGTMLGRILDRAPETTTSRTLAALFLGLLIIYVLVQIPYGIGALIHLAVFCFGIGAFVYRLYRMYRPLPA